MTRFAQPAAPISACVTRRAAVPSSATPGGLEADIGAIDDPLEREAEQTAEAIASNAPASPSGHDATGKIQRKSAAREADPAAHRKPAAAAVEAIGTGGTPLSAEQRAYFEPRFGRDFSSVRLHTGARADAAAKGIGARAYTLGSDIAFAAGEHAPATARGDRLLAHELAHVVQQQSVTIRRAPGDEASKEPEQPVSFTAKDLLVYPLFIDLWNDIFSQKLTDAQKKEFKLKGKESGAFFNLLAAPIAASQLAAPDASFGDLLKGWVENADELHKITGSEDFYLDLFSRFVGINLDAYLGSDLFKNRLKAHAASLVTIVALAQTALSTVQAVKEPSAKVGELEPTQAEKQTLLVKAIFNLVLKEQIKAPDFFQIGPLKLATHPVYAGTAAPTAGGGPPELTFEHGKGEGAGQGGDALKLGLTLNLQQIVGLFQEGSQTAKDRADLQKYRGWQSSLWFSYDRLNPTALQQQAGRLPQKAFHAGTLFGGGGFLGEIEGGARYGGDQAKDLTAWFLRGGFGYSGKKKETIQKMGFTAVYTDWTEKDVFAPRIGEGGAPVGGSAFQLSPFTKLEFGERHKFSVGAALGFVTGTHESVGVSDFRGDFSYTYLGDRSEESLPVFKLDLSGYVGRLDWWNPDSPLMTGVQARATLDKYFVAGQVNTGAGKIPEQRAAQIEDRTKAVVPTTILFTGGLYF